MALRIHIVGEVAVEGERGLVGQADLHGPQGRLVLAMLAAEHPRPVRRDELAEELWPDAVPASWDTAVRVLVSKLRTALDHVADPAADLLAATAGAYQLRLPAGSWIDLAEVAAAVHRAEAALTSGAIEAAGSDALVASMISGRGFLPGIDSPWVERTRERLLDLRVRALVCLAEVWLARGDFAQAARDAEAIVALDPYREGAHRLLMRAHVAAGDRASAARAFRACRSRLAEDLGVEPASETIELAAALGLAVAPQAGRPGA
jgi:DNA-binding SARP family transcriptional activator